MSTEKIQIDDIDDFLPMPGADSIVTTDEKKPEFFSTERSSIDNVIDNDNEVKTDTVNNTLDEIIKTDIANETNEIKKSSLNNSVFKKLVDENVLIPFDDEKSIEDYTEDEIKELLQANFEDRERKIKEQTPKEFFESLPEELQYAAEYVAKGGQDLKGLFKVLADTEEVRSLDINRKEDHAKIVRQYLEATIQDPELVDEQLEEWEEAGTLSKKAAQFKPKLDEMQEQIIQSQLLRQEGVRKQQIQKKQQYLDNIHKVLKPGELNGIKLDSKRQNFLWDEMTTVKYQSMTGKPTNLLGKLLEDYQFGKEPRYDLISEALWLLHDPEDYKEKIRLNATNKAAEETFKKLKTEESRKLSSHEQVEDVENKPLRLKRNVRNIFDKL